MSRKRSHYRPRGVNPQAHLAAIMGAARMHVHDATTRAARVRIAFEQARQGVRSVAHWRELFDAINVAGELVRARVAQDPAGQIVRLESMVANIMQRINATGSATLRAEEINELGEFAADYAGLLAAVTQSEYFAAQAKVEARTRRVLAGEKMPAVRVVEAVGLGGGAPRPAG